ncbi:hypothetical protein C8T65DRAFT_146053 [Cerioporus squamosus]|nr:hypothetical protein C8T65DRAFT_146053 [Cerioporus squamosus]
MGDGSCGEQSSTPSIRGTHSARSRCGREWRLAETVLSRRRHLSILRMHETCPIALRGTSALTPSFWKTPLAAHCYNTRVSTETTRSGVRAGLWKCTCGEVSLSAEADRKRATIAAKDDGKKVEGARKLGEGIAQLAQQQVDKIRRGGDAHPREPYAIFISESRSGGSGRGTDELGKWQRMLVVCPAGGCTPPQGSGRCHHGLRQQGHRRASSPQGNKPSGSQDSGDEDGDDDYATYEDGD